MCADVSCFFMDHWANYISAAATGGTSRRCERSRTHAAPRYACRNGALQRGCRILNELTPQNPTRVRYYQFCAVALSLLPVSLSPSIVYIISAPASPVLGFMVDKTGRNVVWVIIAVVSTLAAHMMLAFTFWNPWIAMVLPNLATFFFFLCNVHSHTVIGCIGGLLVFQSLLGVSYSLLACALWPMVAFVVPEHQLGTAYGLYVPLMA